MLTKEINSHPANNLSEREKVFKCVFLLESRLREQLWFWNLVLEAKPWEVRLVFVSSAVDRMPGNFQWFGFLNVWSFKFTLVHFRSDKHHTSTPWFPSLFLPVLEVLTLMCCSGDCWAGFTAGLCCLILGFPFGIKGMSYFDFLLHSWSVALSEGVADSMGTCSHTSFIKQSRGLKI